MDWVWIELSTQEYASNLPFSGALKNLETRDGNNIYAATKHFMFDYEEGTPPLGSTPKDKTKRKVWWRTVHFSHRLQDAEYVCVHFSGGGKGCLAS